MNTVMSQDHLCALWIAVGVLLVSYTLSAWVASAGGDWANSILIEDKPVGRELVAYFVCAALLALQLCIGVLYAQRSAAKKWHARIPIVATSVLRMQGLETGSVEGRLYQSFFLVSFIFVPLSGLVHFWRKVKNGHVSDRADFTVAMDMWSAPPIDRIWSSLLGDDSFRIGAARAVDASGMKHMVTWIPVVEPILMALFAIVICILSLIYLRAICKP